MDPFVCLTLPQTTIRTLINGFSDWDNNKYKFKSHLLHLFNLTVL